MNGARLLLTIAASLIVSPPTGAVAMVIQRVFGANQSEVSYASAGGGVHVYLSGTGIGSAFAPPNVFIGTNAEALCAVQPFTSTRNRLHCIVGPEGLPPPDVIYDESGRFESFPLRVLKDGRLAQCWHVGGVNHACFLRFDLAGTPRVERLLTPVLQSSGVVRIEGRGIDGGLTGTPGMIMTIFRGNGQLVVGACGEKDCAPSNMGMETIGCMSRVGGAGDAVAEQSDVVGLVYSDAKKFGCKLDALAGGLTGGMFNLSLHAMDDLHRGDAYTGFSTSWRVDYRTGEPFDAELLPRITGIQPALGSLAGGTDLTIFGTGFGSEAADLSIAVGASGDACAVTSITPDALHCRVQPLDGAPVTAPASTAAQAWLEQGLTSYPSQRGARFQWRDDTTPGASPFSYDAGDMLLDSFDAPYDFEAGSSHSKAHVEGWFVPPVNCSVTFFVRLDAGTARLEWSGNETVGAAETLAETPPGWTDGLHADVHTSRAVPQMVVDVWVNPTYKCHRSGTTTDIPCAGEMASWGVPYGQFITTRIYHNLYGQPSTNPIKAAYTLSTTTAIASRWAGTFQALATGPLTFRIHSGQATSVLYVDGVEVVRGITGGFGTKEALKKVGKVFVVAKQWYRFEMQYHLQKTGSASTTPTDTFIFVEWMQPGPPGQAHFTEFNLDAMSGRQAIGGRVWPTSFADMSNLTSASSRRVDLVAGHKYWLSLSCTTPYQFSTSHADRGRCAAGARLHTTNLPRVSRLGNGQDRVHRRMEARVKLNTGCADVTDKEMCCAAIDRFEETCVAAITRFDNGKVCMPATWVVQFQPLQQSACPAAHSPSANASKPRAKLPHMVGCNDIRDRAQCCGSIDGRTQTIYENQPCMAAQVQFRDGAVCHSARYVKDFDPLAVASCAELKTPFMQTPMGEEVMVHEVQRISMSQVAPIRHRQVVTFTATEATGNFTAGSTTGLVQLVHQGKLSEDLDLAAATAEQIEYTFRALHDDVYSGVRATVLSSGAASVSWQLDLITPWSSCANQLSLPLLSAKNRAKVTVSVVRQQPATCLTGGIQVSLGSAAARAVFLPWDATEHHAEAQLNQLLATDGSTVKVHRSGDGHAEAIFTITFLGGGFKPMLQVVSSASLLKRAISNFTTAESSTSAAVAATVEELVAGGADLLPLPGRYLIAPANESVVSVRLKGQTGATCGKPDWDTDLHIGCYNATGVLPLGVELYSYNFLHAWSKATVDRCERMCRGRSAYAFAVFQSTCKCLAAEPSATAQPAYKCNTPCGADEAQLCGGANATTQETFASVYKMPTYGAALPCRFVMDASVTPMINVAYPMHESGMITLAEGSSLTLAGSGLGGATQPTVTVWATLKGT